MMNQTRLFTLTILVLSLSCPFVLLADSEPAKTQKPVISATQTVKVTTIVEAVDLENRTVTLKNEAGELQTITAKNTPNLEVVQVGDRVNVEYLQSMSIQVFANDGDLQPGTGTMTATAVNSKDEAPGGLEVAKTIVTATVHEINIETNTFKLNMPGGEIEQFVAQNPENLKLAAVGDLVVATHTEAMAIYLAEVPAE